MTRHLLLTFRVLATAFGVFCILTRVVTVFVHEPASDKIYSRIERLHTRLNALHYPVLSRHVQFLRVVSATMASAFSAVFGERLVSLQALAVTICYAIAAVSIGSLLLLRYGSGAWDSDLLGFAILGVAAGTFPITFKSWFKTPEQGYTIWITALITVAIIEVVNPLVGLVRTFLPTQRAFLLSFVAILVAAILAGLLFYCLSVGLIRFSLKRMSDTTSLRRMILLPLLNLLPVGFIYGFFRLMLFILDRTDLPSVPSGGADEEMLRQTLAGWGTKIGLFAVFAMLAMALFGFVFLATAFLFLLVTLFLIIHRLSWPIVLELLYATQRYRILNKGKALIYIGLLFIVLGTGSRSLGSWLIAKVLSF